MKYCIVLGLLFGFLDSSAQLKLEVKNPSNIERENELVRIPRKRLKSLEQSKFFTILSNGKELVSQTIDIDGDGKWDELVFSSDFSPNENKTIEIKSSSSEQSSVVSYAHARMMPKLANDSFGPSVPFMEMPFQNPPTDFSKKSLPPYLTEGPALENDKNAFRLYFDTRNTKDIYGKRQPRLVMDSVGSNTKHSYHHLSDWGMDILHVEKSLGAGSLALQTKDPNGKDTLVRLAGKVIVKETYKMLNDGPLFASFRMDYEIELFGKPYSLTETMSIWKGQYFYESEIALSPALKNSFVVAGIADFFQNKMDSIEQNSVVTLYSFGKQSENKDELGMAIMAPASDVAFLKDAPMANSDITRTHLLGQKIKAKHDNVFRFYSCWNLSGKDLANTEDQFNQFLKNEMVKYGDPLRF